MGRYSVKRIRAMRRRGNKAKTPKGTNKGIYNYKDAVFGYICTNITARSTRGKGKKVFAKACKYYQMAKGKF